MKRVAIVVQRCHADVVGGAESLAWGYAEFLRDAADYDVEVLTSRAVDADAWRNVLPDGEDSRDGVRILRFTCDAGHGPHWQKEHEVLAHHFRAAVQRRRNALLELPPQAMIPWNIARQEDWVRRQGPYSAAMLEYIRTHRDRYDAWIFVTYLFAPAVFGLPLVPRERTVLVPAVHDEAPAYLSIYRDLARSAARIFWNTDAEARFGAQLWGSGLPGSVVSMGIETNVNTDVPRPRFPYVLYCGRIDPGKGCQNLVDWFVRFQKEHPGPAKLLLTGSLQMKLPRRRDVRYLGFVSEAEKSKLISAARLLVVPSPHESLSIVALEALARGTPILVWGANPVLRDHAADGRGLTFTSYDEFRQNLGTILGNATLRERFAAAGRPYVRERYDIAAVRSRFLGELDALIARAERAA